jgi:uncharacterized protein YjiS (DUF1127 family)
MIIIIHFMRFIRARKEVPIGNGDVVMRHETIDFSVLDSRQLPAEQRAAVRRLALARAHAARRQALQEMLAGMAAFLRKLVRLTVLWHKTLRARLVRHRAAAELHSLNDRELKDIGVCRCEINALVFAGRA